MTQMSPGIRQSIAGQLLKIIFGLYFILAVIVTGIQLTAEYYHTKDSILKEIQKLPVTFGPGISASLWSYNDELLHSILMGMNEIHIVAGIKTRDGQGKDIISVGSAPDANGNIIKFDKNGEPVLGNKKEIGFSKLFGHEFSIIYTDFDGIVHEIGKGEIYSDTGVIIDRVKYGFYLILINSVIKTLGLWFIFLFFVRRLLGKPLEQLTGAVEQVSLANLENHKINVHIPGNNELKVLRNVFNAMMNKLNHQFLDIQKNRDKLEHLVEERTAELQKTAENLKRSNKDLDQFANVVSHDLQEPLRMVSNYVQLLERRYKGKLDADADDFINFAVDGASRMQNMIQDLLKFSRVGTRGKEFKPADCNEILGHALINLKMAIEESGAAVNHTSLPVVMGDESQLIRLFQNLIGNAIKFHSNELPKVNIKAELKGSEWLFFVSDNGIGIDPEYAEHIFAMFRRLHNKGDYPGSGIGLAVCKKIVERHGGSIRVESRQGKGAMFYFTIPVRKGIA
ncbi:ATP-binding protein [Desulfobacterales bacterium HSG17]|nr:ATP-binding protein [Desulfobacterales bacterium HSG17]